ncbi:MAG: DUF3280 domain-containing protein [Pseudomonadota bacterium]|nr:DUF3280 domain-containing protein [Pseudomonadota bacterium]
MSCNSFKTFWVSACLAASLAPMYAVAQSTVPKSAAVMDFDLVNEMKDYDSAEVTAAQENRLKMISDELRREFTERDLYRVVDNAKASELVGRLKVTYNLHECHGCEIEIGKALEADRIVIAWVQKVSNLILNLNIEVKDVATGQIVYNKSVDLRGNTDVTWMRGIRYMVNSIVEKKQYLK